MSVNEKTIPIKSEIIKYAAQMANQATMPCGHDAAVKFLQRVIRARKGIEWRMLEPGEAAKLIR